MSHISLAALNAASQADFVAALANVVEHSSWIAEQLAAQRPFAGIKQLHAALMAAIQAAEPDVQLALIRAHPDLA
uniref:2-oxo-4-hydroxy-4-carboxy-5-ureidoimidazoline decarboxylase n=1 Tax=uncultured Bradyrhizobium sp. TaxID=199684 RepID=UPI00260EACFA